MDAIPFALLTVAGGFVVLVWGATRFVTGAAATARNLGVSPLLIGLTIMGFGTALPELLVSAVAAMRGSATLGVGNAIGSNVINIALVLGLSAIVSPLVVDPRIIAREMPILLGVMLLCGALIADYRLARIDGLVLLAGFTAFMGWIVRRGIVSAKSAPPVAEVDDDMPPPMPTAKAVLWLAIGIACLIAGSEALVHGAVTLARKLGVSELVIGLTVVAIGTSLPELAASVIAARRSEHEIAVGNVLGSNMFNLLGVLGLAGAISPAPLERHVLARDFPAMVGLTLLFVFLARGFGTRSALSRGHGAVLLVCFALYLVTLYVTT